MLKLHPEVLLGSQFTPRLTNLGEARFWHLDRGVDYGLLNALTHHHINPWRYKGDLASNSRLECPSQWPSCAADLGDEGKVGEHD